jgi:hypothetical protein
MYWMSIYLNIHKSVSHKIYCELLQLLRLAMVLNYNVMPVTVRSSLTVSERIQFFNRLFITVSTLACKLSSVACAENAAHSCSYTTSACDYIWIIIFDM